MKVVRFRCSWLLVSVVLIFVLKLWVCFGLKVRLLSGLDENFELMLLLEKLFDL